MSNKLPKFFLAIILSLSLSGCFSKRILPTNEEGAYRISPDSLSQADQARRKQIEEMVTTGKAALKKKYPEVKFSQLAWYKFPPNDPNRTKLYAVFDCVDVPCNGTSLQCFESAISKQWNAFKEEVESGDNEYTNRAYPNAKPNSFSAYFSVRDKNP